jgi:hypothetical protein
MSECWLCIYATHTGATAHAVFATREDAIQFAERHATTTSESGLPLKWEDLGQSAVLPTQLGDYLITPDPGSDGPPGSVPHADRHIAGCQIAT